MPEQSVLACTRPRPLARCVAAMFLIADGAAHATAVTNCFDSGAGSLRSVIANASSGGTVSMSGLTTDSPGCAQSRISLTTGEIKVKQDSLTIDGPGTDFIVSGKYYGAHPSIENARIFNHTGYGTLALENFALRFGYVKSAQDSFATGGCIYSKKGTVSLTDMDISICRAVSPVYTASGGAVSAKNVKVMRSTLTGNAATGGPYFLGLGAGGGYGGAIAFTGSLYMKYSTLSGNSTGGFAADGGAIFGSGSYAYIRNSTLTSNSALPSDSGAAVGSAIDVFAQDGDYSVMIVLNSTITGNTGGRSAVRADISRVNMYNSTVAFNEGGGLTFFPNVNPGGVTLDSNILSNNGDDPSLPYDLYVDTSSTLTGARNLVLATSNTLPADNIVGECPLLGPLRDNGGVTQTLMLHSRSPAIDAGNNVYKNVSYDQRGVQYARGSGPPDIGAYEVQQDDIVFNAAFDGC